jgi:hypothetical protein
MVDMGLIVLPYGESLPKIEKLQHSLSIREAFSILRFIFS